METKRFKNWWFLAVNGIIAILFGLLLIFMTREFIQTIVFYFGLLILLTGVILLFTAVYNLKKDKNIGLISVQSVISIAIGLIIMLFPGNALNLFLILFGVWAVIVGIFQLVVLVNIRRNLSNKNVFLFNGILTVALGVILILKPFELADVLAKILGIFSTVFGLVMIYLSFVIRKAASIGEKEPDKPDLTR